MPDLGPQAWDVRSPTAAERAARARPPLRVAALFVYPVKSTAERSRRVVAATPSGFAGDRGFQVTAAATATYLTPRSPGCERLFHIVAELGKGSLTLSVRPPLGAAAPARSGTTMAAIGATPPPLVVDLVADRRGAVPTTVLGCPRPGGNEEPLVDFGDNAARVFLTWAWSLTVSRRRSSAI